MRIPGILKNPSTSKENLYWAQTPSSDNQQPVAMWPERHAVTVQRFPVAFFYSIFLLQIKISKPYGSQIFWSLGKGGTYQQCFLFLILHLSAFTSLLLLQPPMKSSVHYFTAFSILPTLTSLVITPVSEGQVWTYCLQLVPGCRFHTFCIPSKWMTSSKELLCFTPDARSRKICVFLVQSLVQSFSPPFQASHYFPVSNLKNTFNPAQWLIHKHPSHILFLSP